MTYVADVAELKNFLRSGRPNEWYVYATANSLMDTLLTRSIQVETYRLAVLGVIYLVQRRVPDGQGLFDYIAIKASKSPKVSLIPYSEQKIREKQGFTKCNSLTA